ncbi:hypothetical protein DFP72DRAFT_900328 [Ephemerocybe angulata]|uniref:F-box domain-containing protein n=1 Tax=Ephemerocybe angulata TaxID=980116 RepID=A0A8H6M7G7_9AGAR|nr:hypothetical protein DFP72DRAFT_900328 [Tulosesus angulatus]
MAAEALNPIPNISSIHKVLGNVEILRKVLGYLSHHEMAKWKTTLANLAIVNRTFFRAAADELWEQVESVEPFLAILKPTKKDKTTVFTTGVTSEEWTRFNLYASRSKSLTLNKSSIADLDPAWVLYLATSKNRPDVMFPALRSLNVWSADQVSVFVALNSITPLLSSFRLFLNEPSKGDPEGIKDTVNALTSRLSVCAGNLSELNLTCPLDNAALSNIRRISSLRSLNVKTGTVDTFTLLMALIHLDLEVLSVWIDKGDGPSPSPTRIADSRSFAPPVRMQTNPNLRNFWIAADGAILYHSSLILAPCELKNLTINLLELQECNGYHQSLMPLTLSIHMARNPGLRSLKTQMLRDPATFTASIPSTRTDLDDLWVHGTQEFLTHLAAQRNLTQLTIGIAFASPDIYSQLLDAVQDMPELRVLELIPEEMSGVGVPKMKVPGWEFLELLSKRLQQLQELTIRLDTNTSTIPTNLTTKNEVLRRLYIYPDFSKLSQPPAFFPWVDDWIKAARYLDRLFPNLESMTKSTPPGLEPTMDPWYPVEKFVFSLQEVRTQLVRELGA